MRDNGKDLRNLQLALHESNGKTIYYISKTYGDKYIVPKKVYEDMAKELEELKNGIKKTKIIVTDDLKGESNGNQ